MSTRKRERRKSLTPEEKYERSVRARRRFKALVHMIIANLQWLGEIEDDQLGDNVKKNVQLLTRKKGKKSLLTLKEKAILNKPAALRTEEELNQLMKVIGDLKCFRRYPADVKNQLPKVMYFVFYGPNRVLVKQDYEPVNAYVILSGEIVISKTWWDAFLKEYVSKDVLVMGPGSILGEVSLLHGIARTATATTVTAVELLYISKDDFDTVLKSTVLAYWNEVQENMSWFRYFDDWSVIDIRESCILSKKKFYDKDEIILSTGVGSKDYVYFVIKGFCHLYEELWIKKHCDEGSMCYELVKFYEKDEKGVESEAAKMIKKLRKMLTSDGDTTTISSFTSIATKISMRSEKVQFSSDAQPHFIKICTYNRLACFNVGETMNNRVIVAGTDAECLLLPRYFLHDKSMSTFKRIEQFLNKYVPNTDKIFKNYLADKKWTAYKKKLIEDILREKKGINTNSIHNVPYSIRLAEDLS